MNKAIELAIVKGGYRGPWDVTVKNGQAFTFGRRIVNNDVILDPLFWQALGKALGWTSFSEHQHAAGKECNGFCIEDVKGTGWKAHWHRFIDHLAEGKDADSFFKDLIN